MKNNIFKRVALSALTVAVAFSAAVSAVGFANKSVKAQTVSPTSLFKDVKNITLTANTDVPSYVSEGWCGTGENDYVTKDDLKPYETNGILVESTADGAELTFKNPVDLNNLGNTSLIDVLPLVTNRFQMSDFKVLTVKLTDADDFDNWFEINISTLNYIDAWEQKEYTFFYLSSSKYDLKPNLGERRPYIENNGFYGNSQLVDWAAMKQRDEELVSKGEKPLGDDVKMYYHPINETLVRPYRIFYNYEKQILSVETHTGYVMDIFELANPDVVGTGNEFNGFKNDRAIISVSASNFNGSSAKYMLLKVGSQALNGTEIEDVTAPSYVENLPLHNGDLPVAVVNKNYNLFDVSFNDFVDGDITPEIFVKHAYDAEYTKLAENKFTPTKAGNYTVRYVGTDKQGNSRKVEHIVVAKEAKDIVALNIKLADFENKRNVGEEISVPDYVTGGGSGKITTDIIVTRLSENKRVSLKNSKFVAYFAGVYEIKYLVSDYVGDVVEEIVWINVVNENAPALNSEISMYERFLNGVTARLPKAMAYDYSSVAGQKLNAVTEITVKGRGEKSNVSEKITDYKFKPSIEKFGNEITIEYKIYCKNYPENAIIRSFNAEIYSPEYVYDYFNYDSAKLSAGVNVRGEESSYVKFTSLNQGNSSLSFVNPLKADYFELVFGVFNGTASAVNVTLTDFENTAQKIELSFKKYDQVSTLVVCNGKEYVVNGAFGATFTSFQYAKGAIYNGIGAKICDVDVDFNSGLLVADIETVGATVGAELRMSKIGSQSLAGRYSKKDGNYELSKFEDQLEPEIVVSKIVENEAERYSRVVVPFAKAYDVITTWLEVKLSVVSPSGKTVISDVAVTEENYFYADEYGEYSIMYSATDDTNHTRYASYTVSVFDLGAPVIVYNGEKILTAKVGETLTFQNATVFDANDQSPEMVVSVINSDLFYTSITETMSFTFEKAGVYTVRYVAYDANFNTSYVDVTVTVI